DHETEIVIKEYSNCFNEDGTLKSKMDINEFSKRT
ncbi:hypothetical protein LCGC14_2639880, partial [marine sediment metagenome]